MYTSNSKYFYWKRFLVTKPNNAAKSERSASPQKSKYLLKNYRPISLQPIFGKIFEKIIYNVLFEHLKTNDILVNCQSGFLPGDSCISQLLSITHDIYKAFDGNPSLEVRGVFLDISKAFDRVWHK